MNHPTEEIIMLYVDQALAWEQAATVSNHLKACTACREEFSRHENISARIKEYFPAGMGEEKKADCQSEIALAGYVEGNLDEDERLSVEQHLSECGFCFRAMIEVSEMISETTEEIVPERLQISTIERIWGVLKKRKAESLINKYTMVLKKASKEIKDPLEKRKPKIADILRGTFVYPSLRFSPVFGTGTPGILSPFGKVRYPVLFQWEPYEGADRYVLKLRDTSWRLETRETHVEIGEEDVRLASEMEYMWEIQIFSGRGIVDEVVGFFRLSTEIESKEVGAILEQLGGIEPEEDRDFLAGAVLEEYGFSMEAISKYKQSYARKSSPEAAYRIAYCYDELELEELRDEWNRKITLRAEG